MGNWPSLRSAEQTRRPPRWLRGASLCPVVYPGGMETVVIVLLILAGIAAVAALIEPARWARLCAGGLLLVVVALFLAGVGGLH